MSSVLVSKIKLNGQIYEIIDRQSEAAIEALTARVDALGNGTTGGVAVETDPIYSADKSNIVFKSDISSLNIALKSDLSTYALKSEIPTKLSDLTQDIQVGGITEETDPTVPAWAKASTKPTYTWTEIQGKPTLFDGDYNKLINKPTIPSLDGLVTQGQLDAIIARLEALEAKPVVDGDTLDFGGGVINKITVTGFAYTDSTGFESLDGEYINDGSNSRFVNGNDVVGTNAVIRWVTTDEALDFKPNKNSWCILNANETYVMVQLGGNENDVRSIECSNASISPLVDMTVTATVTITVS